MNLDPKKKEAFDKLGVLSSRLAERILETVAIQSEKSFSRINRKWELDEELQSRLAEVLAFASMNATIQALVTLVDSLMESFGDQKPNPREMVKLSNEIAYCINQRLSVVFDDLVDLNYINLFPEEMN